LIIDGCPVACGKKIADHLGLKDYGYVEITSLGIKKEHNISKTPANQVEEVVKAAKKEMANLSQKCKTPSSNCCG